MNVRRFTIRRWLVLFLAAGLITGFAAVSSAQTRTLRIAAYNIESDIGVTNKQATFTNAVATPGPPLPGLITSVYSNSPAYGGVLEGIGEEVVNGNAQPVDIVALEETTSNPLTVAPIVNGLNLFYGVTGMYAQSTYQATESGGDPSSGNGPNAVIYNTRTLQLVASKPVDPSGGTSKLGSTSGEYREVMRYEFAPAGVTPNAANEFYIYVSHYKASSGSSNEAKRLGEAQIIRTNEAIDLPATARVLYVGDYNVDTSGEASYQTIVSNTAPNGIAQGRGIDPLNTNNNANIDWSSSTTDPTILVMLTEHAYDLEYRDDLQLMTTNIYFGAPGGLKYVPGTYHAFGNNGVLAYYGTVNSSTNIALAHLVTNGPVFVSAAQIYVDLTGASDHLPVVADYTIPLPAPGISAISLSGSNLIFTATNTITNAVYSVLMSTNLTTPVTNWTTVATYPASGSEFTFTATNLFDPTSAPQFYSITTK